MDPEQPVVSGRHGDDAIDSTQFGAVIRGLEPGESPGDGAVPGPSSNVWTSMWARASIWSTRFAAFAE